MTAESYASDVCTILAFFVSKQAELGSSLCRWKLDAECPVGVFGRQTLSMVWDYAEGAPLGDSSGSWSVIVRNQARSLLSSLVNFDRVGSGHASQADAAHRDYSSLLVSTDPPYYDNVGYADLSDFFYVWLRRSLADVHPQLLGTMLTPKAGELVADPFRHGSPEKADQFFEAGFVDVFKNIRINAIDGYPITVFYAFKQSESDAGGTASTGWEVLLQGVIRSGWEVTGTWPVRTEASGRMRNFESNALASSIVLACRPRPDAAEATSRRGFVSALSAELPSALKELQQGSVAPVDLAQAAIGPGMAVYARYSKVIEADGSDMTVRTALALINHSLDEILSAQEGDFDVDTRFCIKWFNQFGWNEAGSGEADVLARATNTSIEGLVRGGVFRAVAGKARLLGVEDLRDDWNPITDIRTSGWEAVLHLAKTLTERGADEAVVLMRAVSQRMDVDTVKELAYYLYSVCERKGWTQTALLFNGLGTSWLDLEFAARKAPDPRLSAQAAFDFDDEANQ